MSWNSLGLGYPNGKFYPDQAHINWKIEAWNNFTCNEGADLKQLEKWKSRVVGISMNRVRRTAEDVINEK